MIIRQMTIEDADFAFECTSNEGWQSATKDNFIGLMEYDADGCFIGEHGGKRIGLCVATRYRENGFVGDLIVIEEERGKGFGTQLLKHAIKYLQNNDIKNIYLDGDLDAVPIYERYGFRKVCKSLRFIGRSDGEDSGYIRKAAQKDMEKVCKLDLKLFGDDRSFFLVRRQKLFPDYFFVAEIDDRIAGYILAEPGNGLISAGPWAAADPSVNPLDLLKSLCTETKENDLRIGLLESNTKAAELMRSLQGFQEGMYSWRMVLGDSDRLGKHDGLFAVGSGAKG